jgi:hypothetical protein
MQLNPSEISELIKSRIKASKVPLKFAIKARLSP